MPVPAPEGTSLRPSGMGRSDVWPWLACLLFGLLMSTLPHWIRPRPGQGAGWIASKDELGCHLSVGAQAYHNHPWRLTDPVLADGGNSMYPALQLVPGIWIAKIFGPGPLGITLGWHIWAGLMLPTGFYLLLRRFVVLPWAAAALTALLLADHGPIDKRLVDQHFIMFFRDLAVEPDLWAQVPGVRARSLARGLAI